MNKWPFVRLTEIAQIRSSNVDKKTVPGERSVRLCNYMDVYANGGYITDRLRFMLASASIDEIARFSVDQGDVILTKDSETADDIGVPAVVVDKIPNLVCGYHLALIKPNLQRVDPTFLAKQLASPAIARYFSRLANGSTRYGLSSLTIASAPVPLAPLEDQRRIANILRTLDETIAQTEALIAKYEQVRVGLMHDLFTRGLTPDGRLRPTPTQAPHLYKESPVGLIPDGWVASTCDQEFAVSSGITIGPHRRPNRNPHPYLRVGNVFRNNITLNELTYLEAFPGEVATNRLRTFDLLMVEGHASRNEIGRCAMVYNDAEGLLFQNHLFRLRAISSEPTYALHWLNSHHAQRYWEISCATSSGLNTINRRMLGRMPICLAPPKEQRLIVAALAAHQEAERAEVAWLGKLHQQKLGMMNTLLTGQLRLGVVES